MERKGAVTRFYVKWTDECDHYKRFKNQILTIAAAGIVAVA